MPSNFRLPQHLVRILRTIGDFVIGNVRRILAEAGVQLIQAAYEAARRGLERCVPITLLFDMLTLL
jgi:hypothetical protein